MAAHPTANEASQEENKSNHPDRSCQNVHGFPFLLLIKLLETKEQPALNCVDFHNRSNQMSFSWSSPSSRDLCPLGNIECDGCAPEHFPFVLLQDFSQFGIPFLLFVLLFPTFSRFHPWFPPLTSPFVFAVLCFFHRSRCCCC